MCRPVLRFLAAVILALCVPAAVAADGHTIGVSAVVLSASACRFTTASSIINVSVDAVTGGTGSASVGFRCGGSAATAVWSLTHNAGLHGGSPDALRLQHATSPGEYLDYSLSHPASGTAPKNVVQTLTVTATVSAANAQNALPGTFSDTVTLSLLP